MSFERLVNELLLDMIYFPVALTKIQSDYNSCRSERSEERATAEEERSDSIVTGRLPNILI